MHRTGSKNKRFVGGGWFARLPRGIGYDDDDDSSVGVIRLERCLSARFRSRAKLLFVVVLGLFFSLGVFDAYILNSVL